MKQSTPTAPATLGEAIVWPDGPVPVVDPAGRPLSPCTRERALQNLADGLAVWEDGRLRLCYPPLAYRAVYRRVLKRDGLVCAWCGEPGSTLDHIIPLSFGGRTTPANCVVACRACNHARHNLLPSAFLAWTGFAPRHPLILRVLADEAGFVARAQASLRRRPVSSCRSKEEAQVWVAYHGHPAAQVQPPPPPPAPASRLSGRRRPHLQPFLP